MLRANFLIYIVVSLILTSTVAFSFYVDTTVDPISKSITEAANVDKISNEDLATWYSVYRGTYLYGTKFDFEKSKDFGLIFDKQRKIRDTLLPSKTDTFKVVVNNIFKKYEGDDPSTPEKEPDIELNDNTKSKFLEELNSVAEGIKNAID